MLTIIVFQNKKRKNVPLTRKDNTLVKRPSSVIFFKLQMIVTKNVLIQIMRFKSDSAHTKTANICKPLVLYNVCLQLS
jgi:hypothetical protein